MNDKLDEKFNDAIGKLTDKAKSDTNSLHSVQYAQAAMYVANAKAVCNTNNPSKKITG